MLTGVKPIYASQSCSDLFADTVSKQDAGLSAGQKMHKDSFVFEDAHYAKDLAYRLEDVIEAVQLEGDAGKSKIQLLHAVGFNLKNDTWAAPTFSEFYSRYIGLLDAKGVREKDRIYPAVAVAEWNGTGFQDHVLFTPGKDPWPETKKSFRFVDVMYFNIPGKTVVSSLAHGRYPMLSAMHDVFHYLTFIQYPEYAKALRVTAARLETYQDLGQRFNFLNEVLSLPNLKKKNEILNSLWSTQGIPKEKALSFSHFQNFFETVPEAQLFIYAEKFASEFPNYLTDFGGAIFNSREKRWLVDMAKKRIIQYTDRRAERFDESDLAFASPSTFGASLKALLRHNEKPNDRPQEVKINIRKRLASMEYFLWLFTTQNVTPEVFMSQFIRPDGSTDPVLQEALQNIWGPSPLVSKAMFRNQ